MTKVLELLIQLTLSVPYHWNSSHEKLWISLFYVTFSYVYVYVWYIGSMFVINLCPLLFDS